MNNHKTSASFISRIYIPSRNNNEQAAAKSRF